jgi:hypothetical protein
MNFKICSAGDEPSLLEQGIKRLPNFVARNVCPPKSYPNSRRSTVDVVSRHIKQFFMIFGESSLSGVRVMALYVFITTILFLVLYAILLIAAAHLGYLNKD